MVEFNEYNRILSELQDKLDNEDNVLTFLDTLTKLIRDLLGTHFSQYPFVKGLNFDEISPQLALDVFIEVKKGLKVDFWSAYLKKYLLSLLKKYSHPRDVSYDDTLKVEIYYEDQDNNLDDLYIEPKEMLKILFPHLTKAEIQILTELSTEFDITIYTRVSCDISHRKLEIVRTILKLIHYISNRREVSMNKPSSESLVRVLAGIMVSPLFLVLDLDEMARVIATLGGQTVRIPSYSELQKIIPLIILFYEHNIKGKSLKELSQKYNIKRQDLKLVLSILNQIKLTNYEKKNLIIALSKITKMIEAQDSLISQRMAEIEDKLRKNSKTALELYKSLSKQEVKGLEELIKLTNEVLKML